jgi:hypothetical protein
MNKTVEILNRAFASDPNAMHVLMCNYVPCNEKLADDEHIIVINPPALDWGNFRVGFLGLLNGILAANGLPKVAMMWSEDREKPKFLGFCEYTEGTSPC